MNTELQLRKGLTAGLLLLSGVILALPLEASAAEWNILNLTQEFFPQADAVEGSSGNPPAAPVVGGGKLLGFVFFTDEIAPIAAYSGKPIRVMVGLDRQARITGVRIIQHEEPILVVGITDADLARYIGQYVGTNAADKVKIGGAKREGYISVDGISGATITVMVLNRSIMLSARRVALSRGLIAPEPGTSPRDLMEQEDPLLDPTWKYVWAQKRIQTGVLVAGLAVLVVVLVFQDWLAHRPSLLRGLRMAFLIYTLLFIGWYSLAQLSVVNVLTFLHSVVTGFQWDAFLIDPMMFILWGFVAVTIVLWGRGVYCGWLCPFGALQELGFQLAKKLKVPSYEFPEIIHSRLLAIKYVLIIMLFGISLGSLTHAVQLAEVEPFKTAITLRFDRGWPFLSYALALLVISLFIRKFFCRYLCPLGAALTFPGRYQIFEWLRRRRECGRPCQICAVECEVRAIKPTGEIIQQECHYCLDCQITYWDAHKCPPMVERRRRLERISARSEAAPAPDKQPPPPIST